jgi:hypothetical protein
VRTLITGATGLIGRELVRRIPGSVVLSRDPDRAARALGSVEAHAWDSPPPAALQDVDVIFHLAGESVGSGRFTPDRKRRIRDSRVLGTRHLVAALGHRHGVLVSASAVGYYGDRGDELLDERSAPGTDFLAEVCAEWEAEAMAAERSGLRVVLVRMGMVLAGGGGALARMLPAFRMGLGGRLGNGRQWMSFIHLRDAVGILQHASRHAEIRGPVNAVAPDPVTNAEFTRALGRAVHRPAVLAVPDLALRVGLGEMSQILTASQRVIPAVATASGYAYQHPTLDGALAEATGGS